MFVKDELEQFLNIYMENFGDNNKKRILYYYGFEDGICHTGTEAHDAHDDSAKESTLEKETANKRAGPAAVIKRFKNELKKFPLESFKNCARILQQHRFISLEKYFLLLCHAELVVDGFANVKGILSLLHEVNMCTEFEIYGHDLRNLRQAQSKTIEK